MESQRVNATVSNPKRGATASKAAVTLPINHMKGASYGRVPVKQEPGLKTQLELIAQLKDENAALKDELSALESFTSKMNQSLGEYQEYNAALKANLSSLGGIVVAKEKQKNSAEVTSAKLEHKISEKDAQLAYWKRIAHRATVDSALVKNQDPTKALDAMAAGDPATKSAKGKSKPRPSSSGTKREFSNADNSSVASRPSKKVSVSTFPYSSFGNMSAPSIQMVEMDIDQNGRKIQMSAPRPSSFDDDNDDDDDGKPILLRLQRMKQEKMRA